MSSTNKTSLGLNMWEASDKPVRQDFVNDNAIIDKKISELNNNLDTVNSNLSTTNSSLNTIKSTAGIFGNYGTLTLSSQESSTSSLEGSQIIFMGKGGNTGDKIVLDSINSTFRVYGNINSGSLKEYSFRADGIYLNGKKITN